MKKPIAFISVLFLPAAMLAQEAPSVQQVEEEGQHLGEVQQLLLKKIEEMTLLMIQQEKRIKELEKKLRNNEN